MLKIAEGIFVGKANVLFFLVSFLVGSQKEMNRRKWAAEGLSFLTMDADVKVKLIPLHISFLIVLPRDRSLFAQPIRTRKAQLKESTCLCAPREFPKNVSAMFGNHLLLLAPGTES